jgi:4-amino-4-deoxy-L-arabinose transferase-like glycosyltransferase
MYKWLFAGVFILAFLLRVVNLGGSPAGFTPDEASFGYDAYSIIKTGHDQWGNSFPLTFKSFGDYKLPVYTYLAIPSVSIFGLNEFSVRLPNAFLGTAAVIVTYFLVLELFGKREKRMARIASLFLAVSPWHIALSRGAFEANLTTFFLTTGMVFFLAARTRQSLLSVAMLFFGINLFTYHSARLVTPLMVMALLWIYRSDFPRTKKYTLASAIFLICFVTAVVSVLGGSGGRAATSTLVSQNLGSGQTRAYVVTSGMPSVIARLIYNEPSFKLTKAAAQYITYFSPQFLLFEGPHEATYGMVPGIGVLTIFECLGIVGLLFLRKNEKSLQILFFWALVGAIPAAISIGPGHAANRAAILMPGFQILAAYGLFLLSNRLPSLKRFFIIFVSLVSLWGVGSYFRYYYEQKTVANYGMMYGMQELYAFLHEYPTKRVVLSRSLSEAHMYAAFFDPIEPKLFQQASKNWDIEEKGLAWVDQQEGYFVGRYTVNSIDKIRDFTFDNTFIVGKPEEMPENARIVKTIMSPKASTLWVVAERP